MLDAETCGFTGEKTTYSQEKRKRTEAHHGTEARAVQVERDRKEKGRTQFGGCLPTPLLRLDASSSAASVSGQQELKAATSHSCVECEHTTAMWRKTKNTKELECNGSVHKIRENQIISRLKCLCVWVVFCFFFQFGPKNEMFTRKRRWEKVSGEVPR